jgi:hypothetical protein
VRKLSLERGSDNIFQLIRKEDKEGYPTLIKAAKGKKVIIIEPMPRYLIAKCCGNIGHVTNRNTDKYINDMIQGIRDVYSWTDSSIFLRRIRNVKVFNPIHALGFNSGGVNYIPHQGL